MVVLASCFRTHKEKNMLRENQVIKGHFHSVQNLYY